jgi:hypothetical protein
MNNAPHFIGTDANEPDEPHWAIDDDIEIIAFKESDGGQFRWRVIEVGGEKRQVVITYTGEGRMLFDGEDVGTEAFMAYVGLLDIIDESNKVVGQIIHMKNGELL